MKLQTPHRIERICYIGINTNAPQGEEQFGISVGRLYAGVYNNVLSIGWLDKEGCLPGWYC